MHLELEMLRQPTDTSCGPTCLHAVYRHYGVDRDLRQLIAEITETKGGGTLSVHLALHALTHGFRAKLISYNLQIFDPTWWNLEGPEIAEKLKQRIKHIKDEKSIESHSAYLQFVELGGELDFFDLTPATLSRLLIHHAPILTGLSATYLYQHPREREDTESDDVAGHPAGHFVVATGWHEESQQVVVADPFEKNPFNPNGEYRVDVHRFINSIMLGIVTYDGNLLLISPREQPGANL